MAQTKRKMVDWNASDMCPCFQREIKALLSVFYYVVSSSRLQEYENVSLYVEEKQREE